MTHYSNLDFQSETSYWSMEHTKKKKLRDILVGTALILLFRAGVMRTSVPSRMYTILAVQALYSGRRAGIKSLFPIFVVGITAAIAAGMMLVHFIVNRTSADHYSPLLLQVLSRAPTSLSNSFTYLPFQLLGSCIISRSSTGRVYVSFLSDALALAAAFVLFLGHLLHPAPDTSTSATSVSGSPPRPRALSISAAASSSAEICVLCSLFSPTPCHYSASQRTLCDASVLGLRLHHAHVLLCLRQCHCGLHIFAKRSQRFRTCPENWTLSIGCGLCAFASHFSDS